MAEMQRPEYDESKQPQYKRDFHRKERLFREKVRSWSAPFLLPNPQIPG